MHHKKKKDMPSKGIKSVTDLQQCLQFYMYRACVNEPMRSRPYPVYINMRTEASKQTKRKIIQVVYVLYTILLVLKKQSRYLWTYLVWSK